MQNLIIDGFNFSFIAAYGAINDKDLPESMKESKTLHIVEAMLRKLTYKYPYARVFSCWDSKGGTDFRKNLDSSYKANRKEKKPITFQTLEKIKDMLAQEGVINFSIDRAEGDDAIFVLAQALRDARPGDENIIVTRDRDMLQVVQAGFANSVYDPVKKSLIKVPDYPITTFKALVGDKSDNVPGVVGIGEVKAKKIISKYFITGKLELDESQAAQYERCLLMVDATKNPSYKENLTTAKDFLSRLN